MGCLLNPGEPKKHLDKDTFRSKDSLVNFPLCSPLFLNYPTFLSVYHLHSVAEQQPFCCDGGDLVH